MENPLPVCLNLQCVQNQVYRHWSYIMAAKKCHYEESKLREVKKGILEEAVSLVAFSCRMFMEVYQAAGITIMNAHHGLLKVPNTLVNAYLRLHGKTNEEIDWVDLKSIREHDDLICNNPWANRRVNEGVLKPDTTGDRWWTRLRKPLSPRKQFACMRVAKAQGEYWCCDL
jgi:hypothetical protein